MNIARRELKRTKIWWALHNYCSGGCSYCPTKYWGGEEPRSVEEYKKFVSYTITHFSNLGRLIDWTFDGGEPLEFHDFPEILKICKDNNGNIELITNGGKMWLDWWAIEPHVDKLHLTFHYWQNYNLIKFIIEAFQKNKKNIVVNVPIRPDYFDNDLYRLERIQNEFNIIVNKQLLYKNGEQALGWIPYTDAQIIKLLGKSVLEEKKEMSKKTFNEKIEILQIKNPSYTGQLCSAGIDTIYIQETGWASGSECGNRPLGNIWNSTFAYPVELHKCGMVYCVSDKDKNLLTVT